MQEVAICSYRARNEQTACVETMGGSRGRKKRRRCMFLWRHHRRDARRSVLDLLRPRCRLSSSDRKPPGGMGWLSSRPVQRHQKELSGRSLKQKASFGRSAPIAAPPSATSMRVGSRMSCISLLVSLIIRRTFARTLMPTGVKSYLGSSLQTDCPGSKAILAGATLRLVTPTNAPDVP